MLQYDDHVPRLKPGPAQPPLPANRNVPASSSIPAAGTAGPQAYWKDLAAKRREASVVRQPGAAGSSTSQKPNENDPACGSDMASRWKAQAQAGIAVSATQQRTASAHPAATLSAPRMKP